MTPDGTKMAATEITVGSKGNIWTSSDSGATWTERSVGSTQQWRDIAISGTTIAATTYFEIKHVWVSDDGGVSWTGTDGLSNKLHGIIVSNTGSIVAVAQGGNVWTGGPPPSKFALSFSETIKDNANIDKNDFSVIFEGVAQTISSVEISDGKVNITPAVAELCDVEITYTKNATSSKNIIDRADNTLDTFTYKSTTRATFNDFSLTHNDFNSTINIGFSGYIKNNDNIDKNDFSVSINGSVLSSTPNQIGNKVELFVGDGGESVHGGLKDTVGIQSPGQVIVLDDYVYVRSLNSLFEIDKNGLALGSVHIGDNNTAQGGFAHIDGVFYWTDRSACNILKIDVVPGSMDIIATNSVFVGSGQAGVVDGNGTNAKFRQPMDITTDGTNLYVMERTAIRKITLNGDVTTLAGSIDTTTIEDGDIDGIGTVVRFSNSYYKTLTYHDNYLYIGDHQNRKVKKLNLSNNEVTTIITNTYRIKDVEVIDSKIYVLAENDKIYRYNLDGSNEEHFAGDGNGNVNGDLLTAKFSSAYRISHYNGDIYIGEEHGHRVKIIRGISGGSNNIENIKTKNGKVCIKLGNPVNYDKNNISITYTKNTDISKNLFGINNFPVKTYTTPTDTVKPIVKNIFSHYSTIHAGTVIPGQTYRETDKSFTTDAQFWVGRTYLASAGNYVMTRSDHNGGVKKVYIYYYDGTNWNEQKSIPYDNQYGGSYYLTENYAFVGFHYTYGGVEVYKRDGVVWNDFQSIGIGDAYTYVNNNTSRFGLGLLAHKDYLIVTGDTGGNNNNNGVFIFKLKVDNSAYEIHSAVGHSWPFGFKAVGCMMSHTSYDTNKSFMTMNDDYLCVGMLEKNNHNGSRMKSSGVCFIYKKINKEGGWTYHKRLDPIVNTPDGHFGVSMQINSRFLMVSQLKGGDTSNPASTINNGVIYIYDINGNFKHIQTINPNKNAFGVNFSLSEDNIMVSGGSGNDDTFLYKYNGYEFVQVHEIKKLGYNLDNSNTPSNFGISSSILNDVIVVSDYSTKSIYSATLVKNDKKIVEVCFTKSITDNANIDKNDFTIKTDGVSNSIVSVLINSGRLLFTMTNNIVNEFSLELTYTKNAAAIKNILSGTLAVDSFGTKASPTSYTLEDRGFKICGIDIDGVDYAKKTNEIYDLNTSGYEKGSNAEHQLFTNDVHDLLFTYSGNYNSYGMDDGFGKIMNNTNYNNFVLMHKKINNVWTILHRFTAWSRFKNEYPQFGYRMQYNKGYLLVAAPNINNEGRLYLLKYNSSTNLMEKVGYYQYPEGSVGTDFGKSNLAMDDKYIYACTNNQNDIHIFNYSMELVFKTTNFGYTGNNSTSYSMLRQIVGDNYGYTLNNHSFKAFKIYEQYYLMTGLSMGTNNSWNTATDTYVVLVMKKDETLDTWSFFQLFYPNNLAPGSSKSSKTFGYKRKPLWNSTNYTIDPKTKSIFVSAYTDPSLIGSGGSGNTGLGCVYIFNYDETTGLWGDNNIYTKGWYASNTNKSRPWSDKISYPNDAIVDIDLIDLTSYSTYNNIANASTYDPYFGASIYFDELNDRLLVNSERGWFPNAYTSTNNISGRGTVSVYKKINDKYQKTNSIVLDYELTTDNVWSMLGSNQNGDIYITTTEDVSIASASINKTFVIEFTKKITFGKNFDKNRLTFKYNGLNASINNVFIDNDNKLIILSNQSLIDLTKLYILYTPNNDNTKNILSDNISIDSFTYGNITKALFDSVILTNNKLEITFTKTIENNNSFLLYDFEVYISGIKKKLKTIEISNGKLLLETYVTITDINTVKIIYIKNDIRKYNLLCINGVSVDSFEHVVNSTATTFTTQTIESGSVKIEFSDTILDNTNIDKNDFELFISGVINGLTSVSVSNGKVLVSSTNIPSSNINDICIIYRKNSDEKKQLKNTYGISLENFLTNTETVTPELDTHTHYYSNYYSKNTFGEPLTEHNWNTISSQILPPSSNYYFGYSVKQHGNYMFVSGHKYSSSQGRVYIYKYQQDSWVVLKFIGQPHSGNDYFGQTLAYYNDYLIVCSPREDTGTTDAGSAYIFKKDEGGVDNWGHIKTLRNPGINGTVDSYSYFGDRIDIDGDYLCISAYGIHNRREGRNDNNAGAVFIFKKDEGGTDNWGLIKTIQSQRLLTNSNFYFGHDISISDDVLVISNKSHYSSHHQGSEVYLRNGNNWEYSEKLWDSDKPYGGTGTTYFGYKVKTDSNYILSYAKGGNITGGIGSTGIVFLYARDINNKFNLVKAFGIARASNIYFGSSLDIKGDIIAIGAPDDDVTGDHHGGSVYVYSKDVGGKNNWGLTATIRRSYDYPEGTEDSFGEEHALSLNYEKDSMVIGAPYNDDKGASSGSIYLVNQGTYLNEKNKITLNTKSFIKNTTLDINDFTVESYTGLKTISSVDVVNGRVVLTLTTDIENINRVLITYTKNTDTTKNIKNSADIAMNSFSIGDISDVFMTTLFKNTVDTSIDVTFTKDISANNNISLRDFTLKINNVEHTIESISINASGKVKLQINSTSMQEINTINDVYVKYTKSIFTEQFITDYNGNEVITSDSGPPTIINITHPYSFVENIGKEVVGENYRHESRSFIHINRNQSHSGWTPKAYFNAYRLGESYKVFNEWLIAWIDYKYEQHSYTNGAVVVFKYDTNEKTYKEYQFIPYGAIFEAPDMVTRNGVYDHNDYDYSYRYFGRYGNLALNDRYMIIGESSQKKWWLYELVNNNWININTGNLPSSMSNGIIMNEYNYVFIRNSAGSTTNGYVKIYRIIGTNLVHLKDIYSPDTEVTNYKYFANLFKIYGKTLAVTNPRFPNGSYTSSSGTIYIYEMDTKEFNMDWGLVKKIQAPQSWMDVPIGSSVSGSTGYGGMFGYVFDIGDDIIVAMAGENHPYYINTEKERIFIYYKNSGGLNNWGLIKEIAPNFIDIQRNNLKYFGVAHSYWSVTASKDYVTLNFTYRQDGEGMQIFSKNEGGQDNWGLVKEIIPEFRRNPEYTSHTQNDAYWGQGGSGTGVEGFIQFGPNNMLIIPQYQWYNRFDESTSWFRNGRFVLIDITNIVYQTNKISINTTDVIKNSNTYDKDDFTVYDHLGQKTVTNIDISSNSIILTVDSVINDINRILVTYTKDTTNLDNNIKDLNDNKMDTQTFGDITNPNYLSKQLGSTENTFGTLISGDVTNRYVEDLVTVTGEQIKPLDKGTVTHADDTGFNIFSRGNLLFLYKSYNRGIIYVFEYKNGKWGNYGNYKNPSNITKLYTQTKRGMTNSYSYSYYSTKYYHNLFGTTTYELSAHDHSYFRNNLSRLLSTNGLLWYPGGRNQNNQSYWMTTGVIVNVSKMDNQLHFPSSIYPWNHTGLAFGRDPYANSNNLRACCFGDDWACQTYKPDNSNSNGRICFSRFNKNTQRFDYYRDIQGTTFFTGSSIDGSVFFGKSCYDYRANITNDYYVIAMYNMSSAADYNVWKRDANNNWNFLLKNTGIPDQYWAKNSQGILYNHFYLNCGVDDANIILHDLSNNVISKLQVPSYTSSYGNTSLDVCDDFAIVSNVTTLNTPNGSKGAIYIFLRRNDNYFGLGSGPSYTPNFVIYNNESNTNTWCSKIQIHKETKDILSMAGTIVKIIRYSLLYNVVLNINEPIQLRGTEDKTNFFLEYQSNEIIIESLSVDNNNNILLRTQTQITNVNNVGVIYDKDNNDITKNIRDIAGNPLNEFGQINTNPIMVSFVLDSNNNNIIDITHNRKILNASYNINDYQVKEGSTTINVNSLSVDNKIIKLTLSQNITNMDIVEITYTKNTNTSENVKDLFNNVLQTQIIGNTNIPVFNSIDTQPAGITYGTISSTRDHNILSNKIQPPVNSDATSFGYTQVLMGDYLIVFDYYHKRPINNTYIRGALLVYKWNTTTYEYKSITYPSINFYSGGQTAYLNAHNNYVVVSIYNSDDCCIFKLDENDILVEETVINPSSFTGALITDTNSSLAIHFPGQAAVAGGNGIYYSNHQITGTTMRYHRKFRINEYGLLTTGGHVEAQTNDYRFKVINGGGITIKFRKTNSSGNLNFVYTNTNTTSTYYPNWIYKQVTESWQEETLPVGYCFQFSDYYENNARSPELEIYILPFVGFNQSAADRFGSFCDIYNDWLIVGDPYGTSSYNSNGGLVFIFKKENDSWVEKQQLECPISTFNGKWNMSGGVYKQSYFGHHVIIKNNILLIGHYNAYNRETGSPDNNRNQGCVFVYKLNTTSDKWEYETIIASNNFQHSKNDSTDLIYDTTTYHGQSYNNTKLKALCTQSGSMRPMYFNGTYFAMAIKSGDNGYIDIFKLSNDEFTFKQRMMPPHKCSYSDSFGQSGLFINNSYLLVNEYNTETHGIGNHITYNASLCHIYKNNNDIWSYEETFMRDTDAGTGSSFGRHPLMHGNRILAGDSNSKRIVWDKIETANYVDLNFNQTIPANLTLSTSDFSMIYNAVDNPINSVIVYGGKVRLETTISVTDLSNVKLTYTKNANATQNIQNSNGVSVDSFVYKGNTTKPTFDSLTVSTNQTISSGLYTTTITLTFTDTLLENNNIDKNDFSAEYSGSSTTVHTAAISSGKVVLTIKTDNNAVADSDFFLTYTKNTNTTKNIGDGMDNYVDTFNYIPGFAFRDTTISNGKISLNWTTPLNDTVSIDKDDFTVTIDGEPEIITAAEISTKSVLLTSTNTITDASLVRATYTKNTTASKNLKSLTDNEIVETFSTSPEPATLSSTTVGGNTNPNKIYLNWGSVSTTNKSRFSKHNFILRNHRGRRIRFNSIETAGSGQITLTSSQNLIGGNRYFLSYKRDFMRNNRIRDANNRIVDSFWNRPIYTNNITQPNITIESATVNNATPTKILIDLNTEVNVDNKVGMPFTVSCRGSNNLLKSTIVSSYNIINTNNENHIELTTNRTFINGDKILLHYTRPVLSANQIKGSNSGLPNSSRTYNYTVTASNGAFNISGEARKLLYLNRGDTYVFSLSNASLSGHPFKLSLTNNGSHNSGVEYTQGVTITGTPGQNGANLTFVVPVDAPGNLYYYCSNHSGMGSRIFCSGTVINSMPTIRNYDVKNKVGPALFSDFKKLDANIGTNYGFTENVHSINTGEELGKSVEIDGDYSIIGGPGNNRVLINYFSNNAWAQQKELTGQNSSDKFGISVAISGDTAVVGASNYNSNKGKIYIYKRSGTSWNSQQTIEGEGSDDYFGHSVSIDGDTIVTSANEKGSNDFGKIYIYKRSGTTWSLEHNITGSVNNDKIGEKVVVKGDVMAYSTSSHSEHRGNVVIYNRSGSTWSKTEDIVGTKANEKIGKSLSLDTNTLLVGNPDANTVFMYEYTNSEWTRTEEFENTDSTNFGSSVDIDIANNKLVIGADSDTVNGKIYVYEKENSVWNITQDFIGESSGDNYGKDVSISNNRILSSAPNKAKTGGGVSAGKFYYHKLLTTERLEITFDDNLKSRPGIDKDDFVLESDGNANTIEKVYISNGKLIINHQTLITDTNTIVLTYTKNADATKNLLDLDGNAIITFTYPEGPSVEEAGIGTIQLRTKVTTVVPTSITKTNGIFDFRNLTEDKGVKSVVDDTPVKKRLRTRTFIRDIFKELKKKDTTFDSKSGSTKINKNLLAFTEKVSKRVHETVRLYDADSTIDMRSITKGESIYIPLETNESVVISLPNTTIGGGTTDYTFTKNANDTTTISPALDGKDTANDDDVIIHGDYNVAIGSIVVGDNPLHLHIPFIFDVSGNVVVYGEKVVDTQYYTARHEFTAGDPTSSLTADKLKDLYFYSDETENYAVTVLAGKFALNGESEKVLRLQKGVRYIFDLSDATNNTHPFKLSTTKNGTHNGGSEYVTGVRSYGTPGSPDSAVEFFISTNAPAELFYYCGAHSGSGDYGMGSSIKISDKAAMFYRGSDISSNIVKDALHADLCSNTSNIKHDTTHSKVATKTGDYNPPITSTSGNSLGNILVRYIATHLMSHPLAQAFITNDDSIENDVNGTGQNQSKIAETLITQFNDNLVADGTTPRKNQVIQSLFEQMIAGDINRFMVGDDSGKQPIPFKTGDKLVFYVNMKAKLQIESNVISPATPISLVELFPNSIYPLLDDSNGELDAGLWKIVLTIS
ncbi:MAG: hypothetical protein CML42_00145 [Rhodobacteraceae bacterium]|nr:hypothetical protein [Paracoccaceae bacterium]